MSPVPKRAWAAYAVAMAVLIVDQLSKWWILDVLRLPENLPVPIVGPFQFTRIWNQGVSFGMLQARHDVVRWALVLFSVVVAGFLISWARKAERCVATVGFGLIIGGAVGNAIDRARFGAVVDFVDVSRIGVFPWIFNVADSGITVGVMLLLIDGMRRQRPADPVG